MLFYRINIYLKILSIFNLFFIFLKIIFIYNILYLIIIRLYNYFLKQRRISATIQAFTSWKSYQTGRAFKRFLDCFSSKGLFTESRVFAAAGRASRVTLSHVIGGDRVELEIKNFHAIMWVEGGDAGNTTYKLPVGHGCCRS